MKANKTITRRGNSEMIQCYFGSRTDWSKSGGSILMELRFNEPLRGMQLSILMSPAEARQFAMKLLGDLDSLQGTMKEKVLG